MGASGIFDVSEHTVPVFLQVCCINLALKSSVTACNIMNVCLFRFSAFDMKHFFTRAMLANGIICALRLHQRIPEFKLTRHHFALVMSEDSGHYLMFSLIFLFGQPITSKI